LGLCAISGMSGVGFDLSDVEVGQDYDASLKLWIDVTARSRHSLGWVSGVEGRWGIAA
jgi:hypothetical protein